MMEYQLTADQYARLMEASRPTPVMFGSGGTPLFSSPQENANRAWKVLADEMGFDVMSVRPSPKGEFFFLAEPVAAG